MLLEKTFNSVFKRHLKIKKIRNASCTREEFMHHAFDWLRKASDCWGGSNGFAARYKMIADSWQGPYPETTGYIIPTLREYSSYTNSQEPLLMAEAAAKWLSSRQLSDGSIRCNVEVPTNNFDSEHEIVLFDLGAILQGFCSISEMDSKYFFNSEMLANFIVRNQNDCGLWDKYLYFDHFGTHNSLVAYALILSGIQLNNEKITKSGEKCLRNLLCRFRDNGFIDFCSFNNKSHESAFLHPYVYSIEGFLKTALLTKNDEWLIPIRTPLEKLKNDMLDTQCFNVSHYNENMGRNSSYIATTSIAQLSDCWLKYAKITGDVEYHEVAGICLDKLCDLMFLNGSHAIRGGIPSSYPVGGGYGPHTINNWTIKYFIDACIEELNYNLQ